MIKKNTGYNDSIVCFMICGVYCPLYHFLGLGTKKVGPLKASSRKRKKLRKVK